MYELYAHKILKYIDLLLGEGKQITILCFYFATWPNITDEQSYS